jgi:type II secretory pathway component GspD/PulD (secretin)
LKTRRNIQIVPFAFFLAISAISCSIVSPDAGIDQPVYADGVLDLVMVSPQDEGEILDKIREKQDLIHQKNALMIERYLKNSDELKQAGKFDEAEIQLSEALKLDPYNSDVLAALTEIEALLGKTSGEISDIKRLATERYEVRKQQIKFAALATFEDGKRLMDREDYERAILYFERVVNQINWDVNSVDWGTLEKNARDKLAEAKRRSESQKMVERKDQETKAFDVIKNEEQAQRDQVSLQKNILLRQAIDKIKNLDFDAAEDLVNKVLKIDEKNRMADDLLADIESGRRAEDKRDYLRRRREAWIRWDEEIERTRIPYYEILTETDDETWAKISQMRSSVKSLGIADLDDPETLELKLKLKNTRSNFNFDEEEIGAVSNWITTLTAIPVVVDPEVKQELDDNGETVTLRDLANISVESLLNIITQQVGENLTWIIDNGAVKITKTEKSLGEPVIRVQPIQDISFGLTDFRGPIIGKIIPPGEAGEDAETSIFGGELEKQMPIPPEEILNLIRENIARESWDLDQYNIDISQDMSSLLVIHTNEVQKQVADFLDDLRRFSSCVVTIEARFIEINKSFLQEIGADFRGLGGDGVSPEVPMNQVTNGYEDSASRGWDNQGDGSAGSSPTAGMFFNDNSDGDIRGRSENYFENALGDLLSTMGGGSFQFSLLDDTMFNLVVRAVEKSYNATEITSPIITVFNTQRAYITVINQISYVQGFDVDVANSAYIANPNIGVIQDGIVLDVKPTVSYDRKYITLEIQATVADLLSMRTITTSLGGQSEPVTFQMPTLHVSTTSATVVVPDGGYVVLGGLKSIRYINRKATTPILGDIPIVNFFFSQKGIDDEVMNLVVVARADISDMNTIRNDAFLDN